MQSRLLRITSANASALLARANLDRELARPIEYTARSPYAVLTTPGYETALNFCMRAGCVLPDVLQVADGLGHADAVARWL